MIANLLNYTDIVLSDNIIIEAIHELSSSSAAGPDGIPFSLLVNCGIELAPLLLTIFTYSLSSGVVALNVLQVLPYSNQVT